jgi:glycosyltransferase involved in cell wall biosynthesis
MGHSRSARWIRRLCGPLSRILPERILYVAQSAREAHEAIGYDAAKAIVVPNGYLIPAADSVAAARRRTRDELGLDERTMLVGSAGRFSPQKGYRGFIEAAAAVARRFPDAHFLMFGREVAWDNVELAGWIGDAKLTERFHLLGERRDVLDCLSGLDIFALFSIGEGFPNIVAEAMSAGVPCIVTDVGDAARLVGDAGIVIEPNDVDALTGSLEWLIGAGEGERRRLGEAGRRRVETAFSLSAVAERYAILYDEMAGDGRAPTADAGRQGIGA